MKRITTLNLAVLLFFAINSHVSSQNIVTAYAIINSQIYYDTVKICEGDSIQILSTATSNLMILNSDFNNSSLDSSWNTNITPSFINPCPPTTLPASGVTCWFGSNVYPRAIVSKAINISNNGNCKVSWDMKYGANQNTTNCESPDLPTEGVHLQWSINNGTTWTDFPGPEVAPSGNFSSTSYINGSGGYWTPVSGNAATGSYYTWNHYENYIPQAAFSSQTRIRWHQDIASGNSFDHWGMDNVKISCDVFNYVEWLINGNVSFYTQNTDFHIPSAGTHTYVVSYLDLLFGITTYDTIIVLVKPRPLKPNIFEINGTLNSNSSIGNQWYFNNNLILNANSNIHIPLQTGFYSLIVWNNEGCKSISSDSIYVAITGIDKININQEIYINPNPVTDFIKIFSNKKIHNIQIFDINGRILKTYNDLPFSSELDVRDLLSGVFIIRLFVDDKPIVSKFIKN